MSPNVRPVPSCYPCGYAGQFGPAECLGCRHNIVGSFATTTEMSEAAPILKAMNENLDRRYAVAVDAYGNRGRAAVVDPPRIPRRVVSPHVQRNRLREQRTRAFLIVVFVWMILIVAAQTRACVATSPQEAARQQIDVMHDAGISTTGGRP